MASVAAIAIEEDPQVRRSLRRTLSRHGFRLVEVPILALAASGRESEGVAALEAGADDYNGEDP